MTNHLIRPLFSGLSDLHHELDRLFDRNFFEWEKGVPTRELAQWVPKIDIKDENNQYIIHADVPGVNPKDIEINYMNGMLILKGKTESNKKEEKENYVRVERSSGSFYRAISLPNVVDSTKISAKSKNGVLEITIPKNNTTGMQKIEIKQE